MTDDPIQRLRQEFLDGAQTLAWDEIWLRMASARFALIDELQGVSQEQADWTPAGGTDAADESTWSIAEIMRHVITASPNIAEIIAATANGQTVVKGPPGQITAPASDVDDLRLQVTSVSERLLSVANAFPEEIDREATVPHAFFGELPSMAWPLFQAFHDGDHTRQIEALKAHRDYPA
ncbi:MAG: DinB family protein [Chloroflexi bacterium]|nr:DinB family protein [Chloroflexota bacterium]MYF81315.1 DinB family protein [Chloroflexota bacterium]MYI04508.1 DinB family protein [Chloroflexota bacterium]